MTQPWTRSRPTAPCAGSELPYVSDPKNGIQTYAQLAYDKARSRGIEMVPLESSPADQAMNALHLSFSCLPSDIAVTPEMWFNVVKNVPRPKTQHLQPAVVALARRVRREYAKAPSGANIGFNDYCNDLMDAMETHRSILLSNRARDMGLNHLLAGCVHAAELEHIQASEQADPAKHALRVHYVGDTAPRPQEKKELAQRIANYARYEKFVKELYEIAEREARAPEHGDAPQA